jgi:hypothetical protein
MYIFFFAGRRLTWQVTSTYIPVYASVLWIYKSPIWEHAVAQLVEALRYKPEGIGTSLPFIIYKTYLVPLLLAAS